MSRQSDEVQPEVEWQFDALDLRLVERWLQSRQAGEEPGLLAGEVREQRDVYLDTDDWRIAAAGLALRVRRVGSRAEATLKSRDAGEAGLRRRIEISQPFELDDVNTLSASSSPVDRRVQTLQGGRALRELFSLRTRRQPFELRIAESVIGELALDETVIPLAEGVEPVRLARVEIEVNPAALKPLEPFVASLVEACHLRPASLSKFDLALLAHGLTIDTTVELGSTQVEPGQTIGEVAFAVLRKHLGALLMHEPGSRLGDDVEELHDMRVAARRLRAALSLFADVLPLSVRRAGDDLRWVASALGDVRDLDVQLEQLEQWESEVNDEDRAALHELARALLERRGAARCRMLAALDSSRYERFVDSFAASLRRGASGTAATGRQPALQVAPELIGQRYAKVRKQGDTLTPGSAPTEYHALRIGCKRLRYALEFLSPLYGGDLKPLIATVVDLQDLLGEHQDADVAIAHLTELSRDSELSLPPQTIFVMGKIAYRYEIVADERLRAFPKAYRQLKSKRWRRLARVLNQARRERERTASQKAGASADR